MRPSARLTTDFRERCARTGLTDGAVHAGLAATFAEVAEPVPINAPE